MLQIYRIILEYPSNIYIFLDIFQLSTLFYSVILKLVLTMSSTFLPCKRPNVERSLGSSKNLEPLTMNRKYSYIVTSFGRL